MTKTEQELSRNEVKALQALLSQPTIARAAEQAGLSERSLCRYMSTDRFRGALKEQQDAMLSSITSSLLSLSTRALETLAAVLGDETATPASKTRAALGVLQHTREMAQLHELQQRLIYLEERVLEVRSL